VAAVSTWRGCVPSAPRRVPQPEKRAFFGLLPESISHEGYAKRAVHSFWDDLFALRGLQDAAWSPASSARASVACAGRLATSSSATSPPR
jgi:hypothetical protein